MDFDKTYSRSMNEWLIAKLAPICDNDEGALAEFVYSLLLVQHDQKSLLESLKTELPELLNPNTCDEFVQSLCEALNDGSYKAGGIDEEPQNDEWRSGEDDEDRAWRRRDNEDTGNNSDEDRKRNRYEPTNPGGDDMSGQPTSYDAAAEPGKRQRGGRRQKGSGPDTTTSSYNLNATQGGMYPGAGVPGMQPFPYGNWPMAPYQPSPYMPPMPNNSYMYGPRAGSFGAQTGPYNSMYSFPGSGQNVADTPAAASSATLGDESALSSSAAAQENDGDSASATPAGGPATGGFIPPPPPVGGPPTMVNMAAMNMGMGMAPSHYMPQPYGMHRGYAPMNMGQYGNPAMMMSQQQQQQQQQQHGAAAGGHQQHQRQPHHHRGSGSGGPSLLPDDEKCTIRCTGVPVKITEADIKTHFRTFGRVVSVQILPGVAGPDTPVSANGEPKIYNECYLQFDNPESAKKCHTSPAAVMNNRFIKLFYAHNNLMPPSEVQPPSEQELDEDRRAALRGKHSHHGTTYGAPFVSASEAPAPMPSPAWVAKKKASMRYVAGQAQTQEDCDSGAGVAEEIVGGSKSPTAKSPHHVNSAAAAKAKADQAVKQTYDEVKQLRTQAEDILKKKETILQTQIEYYRALMERLESSSRDIASKRADIESYESKIIDFQSQLRIIQDQRERGPQLPARPLQHSRYGSAGVGAGTRGQFSHQAQSQSAPEWGRSTTVNDESPRNNLINGRERED